MNILDICLVFVMLIAFIVIIMVVRYRSPFMRTGGGSDTNDTNNTNNSNVDETNLNIIHIGGAEASGKTTLAGKLKEHYLGANIGIYDLDDLYTEYEGALNSQTYPSFVMSKSKHHAKTIYVGIPAHLGKGMSTAFDIPAGKKICD